MAFALRCNQTGIILQAKETVEELPADWRKADVELLELDDMPDEMGISAVADILVKSDELEAR